MTVAGVAAVAWLFVTIAVAVLALRQWVSEPTLRTGRGVAGGRRPPRRRCRVAGGRGPLGGRDQPGPSILSIPTMAVVHGLVNAFGFTLLGMLGWYQVAASAPDAIAPRRSARNDDPVVSR